MPVQSPSTRYAFCKVCHGINKSKCYFCKMSITDYRKVSEPQVNHHLYLRSTWAKLKKFKMLTTGVFQLDEQLHTMWGQWREVTAAESYARDIMRGKPFPEYLRDTSLGPEIEEVVLKLHTPVGEWRDIVLPEKRK